MHRSKKRSLMSELGQKRHCVLADYVRFTPESGHREPACHSRTSLKALNNLDGSLIVAYIDGHWARGLFPASGSRVETKLSSVCLFKQAQGLFHVVGLLPQRFRIPFASLGSKKIASVNVNGAGQTWDRVGH